MDELRRFVRDRDEALLSLNEEKIRAYCKRYDIPIPENPEVFWRGVHKSVCNLKSATEEQRMNSLLWLMEHNSSPEIG